MKNKNNPYLTVSNKLIKDERLSLDAKGIMIEILSNADSFVVYVEVLKKKTKLTRKRFYDAWNLLQELGYVEAQRKGNNYLYNIYEAPETRTL